MITARDEPIIRRALSRRLDSEPGVHVLEIHIFDHKRYITVGCLLHIDDKILVKSLFDLEPKGEWDGERTYELKDVHNQADEIAESCKEARRTLRFTGSDADVIGARSQIYTAKGTGRRGHWKSRNGSHA